MSTTITQVQTPSATVTRFLEIRSYGRRTKVKSAVSLNKTLEKIDPRATLEDFLRRKQRLEEELADIEGDEVALMNDGLAKAVKKARTDLGVIDQRRNGGTVDHRKDRAALKDISASVEKAMKLAGKHVEGRNKEQPELARELASLEDLIEDPYLRATKDDAEGWSKRLTAVTKQFLGAKPDFDAVGKAVASLRGDVLKGVVETEKKHQAFLQRQGTLMQAMATSSSVIEELAEVDQLLGQAAREAGSLDYDAAEKTQKLASARLGNPKQGTLPTMAACEQRRKSLHAEVLKLAPPKNLDPNAPPPQGVATSQPARESAVALLHRLDGLRGLCAQGDEVAVEAARRLDAIEAELKLIRSKDGAADTWSGQRTVIGKEIEKTLGVLRGKVTAANPRDGALGTIEGRLGALEQAFARQWPTIMVQADLDESGLQTEASALVKAMATWRKETGGRTTNREGQFLAAVAAAQQATADAREANFSLLEKHGLMTAVPKLITDTRQLIAGKAKDYKEKAAEATKSLLVTVKAVRDDLAKLDPKALEQQRKQAKEQVSSFAETIGQQVEAIKGLLPTGRTKGAKTAVRNIISSAFSDDVEREARASYGATLQAELEALSTMLDCDDPSVVAAALLEIKAFKGRIDDLTLMAKNADKAGKPAATGLPLFTQLTKDLQKVEEQVGKNGGDSDLATRVDELAEWNRQIKALRTRIGKDDPRKLDTEITALAAAVETGTERHKKDIKLAVTQYRQLLQLEQQLADAGDTSTYPDLVKELLRSVMAMKTAVDQWKQVDAGFDELSAQVLLALKKAPGLEEAKTLTKGNGDAKKTEQAVQDAETALRKLRDADLKLWAEKFGENEDKKARKLLLQKVADFESEVERAFDSLRENRDPAAAQSFIASVLRELQEAALGPMGDHVTRRGDLETLKKGWHEAVSGLHQAMETLADKVAEAGSTEPDDLKQAAAQVGDKLVGPVKQLFDVRVFDKAIDGMASKDPKARATNREFALREVRRLRRMLDSDDRIRLLTLDNPFGDAVPFANISSRLFDIELNVTRATGGRR